MPKRKFYDWRYNTKSAIHERKQKLIEQTALERRKRQAVKQADIEAQKIPQAISSLAGTLESDALLERYESQIKSRSKPKAQVTTPQPITRDTTTEQPPSSSVGSDTTATNTPQTFQQELASIKKLKISKHDKGLRINILKQKYKAEEAAAREIAAANIDKSDKRRLVQTKRMQKKKKSGQLKIGGASRVLLQRIHKSLETS